ncbi:integrin alpha-2 isoform X2 [Ciona intestinalis]
MNWLRLLTRALPCYIAIIYCVATIEAENVETREFHSLSPIKNDSAVIHFGASVVIKTSASSSQAFVGAPLYDRKNGSLYKCTFDGKTNGSTQCSREAAFGKTGAMGISLSKDVNDDSVYVCGNQHVINCPKSQLQRRMIGACYKKSTTSPAATLLISPCTTACPIGKLTADIIFVVDESGTVNTNEYLSSLNWMKQVILAFRSYIDTGDVAVGVIGFSRADTETRVSVRLQRWAYETLLSEIDNMIGNRAKMGPTYIGYAINLAITEFNSSGRKSTPKEMILLTDGDATDSANVQPAAEKARANGIVTVSVGVGDKIVEAQLLTIAGAASRVFKATDYDNLASVVEGVKLTIQDTASVKLEGVQTNTTNKLDECQLGISSHVTKNNKMYVGAVGSYDRAGTVVDYSASAGSVSTQYRSVLNITEYANIASASGLNASLSDTYLGYSVTSGNFFGANVSYVASGAPKYNSKGMVAIYESNNVIESPSNFLLLRPSETSGLWQLGAYFGHSVCAVDINKDSLDDLIVSAPLFSDVTTGYDQGRVFVFINNQNDTKLQKWVSASYRPQSLSGSNAKGARFGMSVAVVGDVDLNGYDDIAVGAPFEEISSTGSGAVYIYYGSSKGLGETRKQRITGKSVTSPLKTFGGFIVSGTGAQNDVDGNGYSDVIISAPSSDRIIILRARPIVKVRTQITLNPPSIDLINCLSNSSVPCTSVTVCLTAFYTDDQVLTSPATINVTMKLDSLLGNQGNKRLVFAGTTSSSHIKVYNVTSLRVCFTLPVQLNPAYFESTLSTGDFGIVSRLEVSYDYTASHKNTIMSAMLDPWSPRVTTADWSFQKKCSEMNGTRCSHDLKIETVYSVPSHVVMSQPLILGSNPGLLSINVTITNLGPDHSYFTRVNVVGNLDLTKVVGTCVTVIGQTNTPNDTTVTFKSANSNLPGFMLKDEKCIFILEYSLESLTKKAIVREILLKGFAYSGANDTANVIDPILHNNQFELRKQVFYAATIAHTSNSVPNSMFYNRTMSPLASIHNISNGFLGGSTYAVFHKHLIENRGPSPVAKASLVFTWPRQTKEGLPLLYLYHFQCLPSALCHCATMDKVNEYGLAINNGTGLKNISIDFNSNTVLPTDTTCNDVKCDSIMCTVNQLGKFSTVVVTSSFKVWLPTLTQNNLATKLSSKTRFNVTDSPIYNLAATTTTATTVVSKYSPPAPQSDQSKLDIGPLIGAIVGGIILLVAIMLIMWKVGFFESKYAKMLREAEDTDDSHEAENADDNHGAENTDDNEITVQSNADE